MKNILIGKNPSNIPVVLHGNYANRHGLIAGATGTGKTVTLVTLIEGFSRLGVPTFVADVKGDLSGVAKEGVRSERVLSRVKDMELDWHPEASPVSLWDIYGESGAPITIPIDKMGPILLGRLLELNETRQGVLEVLFKLTEDEGIDINTVGDLRKLLMLAADKTEEISRNYGLVSKATIAGIQRGLLSLVQADVGNFFGEECFDFNSFIKKDERGRGIINILSAETLILKPRLYSTFLLWLLTELFENLPEVGDMDVPKFVMFFDEAHLLFENTSKVLVQRIEQVVRLIRSKGVGVYFCTQRPNDVPENILGQLGNRIQHALRAFTIRDQKSVKVAAETFPINKSFNARDVITELSVGEALVSVLGKGGRPTPGERVMVAPPRSFIGPLTEEERRIILKAQASGHHPKNVEREKTSFVQRIVKRANIVYNSRVTPEEFFLGKRVR